MESQSIKADIYARVGSLPLSESVEVTPLSINPRGFEPTVQSLSMGLGSLGENHVESPHRVSKNRIQCMKEGCHTNFSRNSDLLRHQEEVHGPRFCCEYLNCTWAGTKRKARYNNHLIQKHGATPFELIIPTGFLSSATFKDITPPSNNQSRKRRRKSNEDEQSEDEGAQDVHRLRDPHASRDVIIAQLQFACPYRKHDAQKYNVNDWRICALTPQNGIHRVKEHLTKQHRIHQCPRCKIIFSNQEELEKHGTMLQGCELFPEKLADGVTASIALRLHNRKKSYPGQPDSDRWREIYEMLFPGEPSPNPYFTRVVDGLIYPGLEHMEEFTRTEITAVVQEMVEENLDPDLDRFRERYGEAQMVVIAQQCLERLLSRYRASLSPAVGGQTLPAGRNDTVSQKIDDVKLLAWGKKLVPSTDDLSDFLVTPDKTHQQMPNLEKHDHQQGTKLSSCNDQCEIPSAGPSQIGIAFDFDLQNHVPSESALEQPTEPMHSPSIFDDLEFSQNDFQDYQLFPTDGSGISMNMHFDID